MMRKQERKTVNQPKPEGEHNKPRGHIFDGIFEYDNDLPRWWVYLFILTIIFAVGYMAWYHSGLFESQSLEAEYAHAKGDAATAATAAAGQSDTFDYAAASKDEAKMTATKAVFQTNCAPCHGQWGNGVVGPNLTDDFWLHGHTAKDIENVIATGALEKGMPGWTEVLGAEQVRYLAAYVFSLQGTNPPDPKAPQGEAGKLQ